MPFQICFSCPSIHAQSRCYSVRQIFQSHLLEQVPKTYFLEPLPLPPPRGLSSDQSIGAFKVMIEKRIRDVPTKKRDQSNFRMLSDSRQCISFCFNQAGNDNTLSNQQCCIPLTFCCFSHTSESLSAPALKGKGGHSLRPHPFNSSS